MRINLISSLSEDSRLEAITSHNDVCAWFLHKALVEAGVDARLIKESRILKEVVPETDHTIVVSEAAYTRMRNEDRYTQRLRAPTIGKLTCYINTDKLKGNDRFFDYCFTHIGPVVYHPEKYICAGWGVSPDYSYPEQREKAAFLDSKNTQPRKMRKIGKVLQIYDRVLTKLDVKTHNLVVIYNKSGGLPYPNYQAILRKCHYFLCTHVGEGGLNWLEAAACGALLVVPRVLLRKRTLSLLNHRVWSTEEELVNILQEDVNIEANRQRALEHTWDKVAKRILDVLIS